MKKATPSPLTTAAGTAFAITFASGGAVHAEANPFKVIEAGGLTVAEAGEAQCGGAKQTEADASGRASARQAEPAEAKCGTEGKAEAPPVREASCGEAKCGANK